MVLVDILCLTLQRESALCQEAQSLWTSRVRSRVPNPPMDTSVCELVKVKCRSHPDQVLTRSVPLSLCVGGGGGGAGGRGRL